MGSLRGMKRSSTLEARKKQVEEEWEKKAIDAVLATMDDWTPEDVEEAKEETRESLEEKDIGEILGKETEEEIRKEIQRLGYLEWSIKKIQGLSRKVIRSSRENQKLLRIVRNLETAKKVRKKDKIKEILERKE